MIQKTSTTYAPWHILESVDKKYARIKALRIVIAELEKSVRLTGKIKKEYPGKRNFRCRGIFCDL